MSRRDGPALSRAVLALSLVALLLSACGSPGSGDAGPLLHAPPPPQALLIPGEPVDGDLEDGETDRWVFAAAAGMLATVEVWFRLSTSSGPETEVQAVLVGPEGSALVQEAGTVTLPPYIVERELAQTGSYQLQLVAPSSAAGRYTLLVTLSSERFLTDPEVYTETLGAGGPPAAAQGGLGGWGFIWPSPRRAISGWYFHDAANPGHVGLDIAAFLYDPIVAVAAGTVSLAGDTRGYGNLVIVDHPEGWQSWYAHLSLISVTTGQRVAQGEVIGSAGSTGFSTGPHLHFELRFQGQPVDPLVYLR